MESLVMYVDRDQKGREGVGYVFRLCSSARSVIFVESILCVWV